MRNHVSNFFLASLTLVLSLAFLGCSGESKVQNQNDDIPLRGTSWVLIELMGKEVGPAVMDGRDLTLIFDGGSNRMYGYAGCNTFNGSYKDRGFNRVEFSGIASTLRACPDMEQEQTYYDVLAKTDNYAVKGGILSLHKAKMAPLARFRLQPLR